MIEQILRPIVFRWFIAGQSCCDNKMVELEETLILREEIIVAKSIMNLKVKLMNLEFQADYVRHPMLLHHTLTKEILIHTQR